MPWAFIFSSFQQCDLILNTGVVAFFSTNVVMNYSEVETKVREATNDEAWGPHGTAMQDIAQYTFTYEHFPEVMGMLWKRMFHDNKKSWRRVYKVPYLSYYKTGFPL